MSDPFAGLRRAATSRVNSEDELRREIWELRALGFSLRAIAGAAGLSPDTVWRWTR